jgi:hypothetical protein
MPRRTREGLLFLIIFYLFPLAVSAADVYEFNFLFYKSGNVFLEKVYHIDSVPETPLAGDYELKVISSDGSVLHNVSFGPVFLAFTDPGGPIAQDAVYTEISIPVNREAKSYVVTHKGKELLSFRVEENCTDDIDDDSDGYTDCADTDCTVTDACRNLVLFSDRANMPLLIENNKKIIIRTALINNIENSTYTDVSVYANITKPDGSIETIHLKEESNKDGTSYFSKEYNGIKQTGYYHIVNIATGIQKEERFVRREEMIILSQQTMLERIREPTGIISLIIIILLGAYIYKRMKK